ncbi:MAG: DUF502 domain-containing protein [candidate division WOR-3 bacterium]|nr:DUF502 domain-containing protein [candidate division WOR-3 bacterium]
MGLRQKIKRRFITGFVAVLPLALTIWVLWFLILKIGGFLGVYLTRIAIFSNISKPLSSLLGFLAVIIGIYLIGVITSGFLGKWFINQLDTIMAKLPFVKGFYNAARRLVDTIFIDRAAFSKVVIIKYPWKNTYTLAFLTNKDKWKIGDKEFYNVFLPTSPNPTSGFYLLYPVSDIIETKIPIQEAFKTIASGGVIIPDKRMYQC